MEWDAARRRRFRFPWRSRAEVAAEVDEELALHLELRAEELVHAGVPPHEARREAEDRFGDLDYTRRYCVEQDTRKEERVRRRIMFDELRQDVLHGCRRLWKARGFSTVAILTLALGIGANVSVFSLVNAALLRPLPYANPDRLVLMFEGIPEANLPKVPYSAPDYLDLARDQRSYDAVGAYAARELELGGISSPRRVLAARVTASMLPLLGVSPVLGRTFTEDEDGTGATVAVLGHGLWQRQFGGRAEVLGSTITLDRRPYQVVGVMPASFQFPPAGAPFHGEPAELWVPMSFTALERTGRTMGYNHGVIGRLKDGVSLESARAELPVLVERTFGDYPVQVRNAGFTLQASAFSLRDEVVGDVRVPLLVLLSAVGLVLLVACANVASLFLSRAASREHEMTVMAALGASRRRLRQMLLTESLLLGLFSGLAGLVLAWWVTTLAPAALPDAIGRLGDVTPDLRVLAFTLVLSVVAALFFGLAPMLTTARVELQDALRATTGTLASARRRTLQQGLVIATVAFAVVLLVGAGLLARSFAALVRTDVGVRADHLLTAYVSLPGDGYPDGPSMKAFFRNAVERLQALPGVSSAAAASDLPLASREQRAFAAESSPLTEDGAPRTVAVTWVMGDYFRTLGIPLERGRLFDARDRDGGEMVIIVSRGLARAVWPDADPIGRRIKFGVRDSDTPWMTVVGVVGDVRESAIDAEPKLHIYQPFVQVTADAMADTVNGLLRTVALSLRTVADPAASIEPLRRAVAALDPALPVDDVRTLEDRFATPLAPRRFSLQVMLIFAAGAALMVAVGLYGVLAFSVAQRTREFGVRLTLGATSGEMVALVAGHGLRLTAMGLVIGLAGALALSRFMSAMLYETAPRDPWTFIAAPIALAAVALLACYLPARRAARIEPVRALRME